MRSRHSETRDILRNLRFGWSSCTISLNVSCASGLSLRYPWLHIYAWLLNFPRWGKVTVHRSSSRTHTFSWRLIESYMLRYWTRTIALLGQRRQRICYHGWKYHVVIMVTKNFRYVTYRLSRKLNERISTYVGSLVVQATLETLRNFHSFIRPQGIGFCSAIVPRRPLLCVTWYSSQNAF